MTVRFLAIKVLSGDGISVGVGVQGDTAIAAGFAPDAMMFASAQLAAGPTDGIDTYQSLGAVDTEGTQFNVWAGAPTNSVNTYAYTSTVSAIRFAEAIGLSTIAEADVTLNGTGASLAWLADDASDAQFGWIAFSVDTVPHPVEVDTDPATDLTSSSVTLNGTVTPNEEGVDGTWWFDWGLTTDYGSETDHLPLDDGFDPIAVDAPLVGLSCGTEWHYRLTVVIGLCTYHGPDVSFTTDECTGTPSINMTFGV